MITNLTQYLTSAFVLVNPLCFPGQHVGQMSGYDSRSTNTSIDCIVSSLTVPTANTASQITNAVAAFGIVEQSNELRIGANRQLAVAA